MSDPDPIGSEVDPSEGSVDDGAEQQQNYQAGDAEGEDSTMPEVDPSEGPAE